MDGKGGGIGASALPEQALVYESAILLLHASTENGTIAFKLVGGAWQILERSG